MTDQHPPADQPDQIVDILRSVYQPIRPGSSVLERAMSEAVDYWQGEARWWRRCAYAGWGVAMAIGTISSLLAWVLR